jgi:small subunit ribosomal protein S11
MSQAGQRERSKVLTRSLVFRKHSGVLNIFVEIDSLLWRKRKGRGIFRVLASTFSTLSPDNLEHRIGHQSAMSRTASRRLLAQSPLTIFQELAPACRLPLRCLRPFWNTTRRSADEDGSSGTVQIPRSPSRSSPSASPSLHPKAASGSMANLATSFSQMIDQNNQSRNARQRSNLLDMDSFSSDGSLIPDGREKAQEPHRFHIYATRHNTHITVHGPPGCKRLKPTSNQDPHEGGPLISVSAGNLGFRKSGRKHYDSAFQLASYVMGRMDEAGVSRDVKKLEVVLRGFGAGREAVTKALLGTEGRFLRGKVVKVADATRLKFGGTRSKKPRRLG